MGISTLASYQKLNEPFIYKVFIFNAGKKLANGTRLCTYSPIYFLYASSSNLGCYYTPVCLIN
jgi:hypothetical protein